MQQTLDQDGSSCFMPRLPTQWMMATVAARFSRRGARSAVGRSGGSRPLELHVRIDVGRAPVAVLRNPLAVEQLPAGGDDDVAHFELDDLVLLVVSTAAGGQTFEQTWHLPRGNQVQLAVSITGVRGTACGNGV